MSVSLDADRVGGVIAALGSPRFGSQYVELFSDVLAFDQCTVFAFRAAQPPDPVVLEGRSAQMRELAQALGREYVSGGFKQDPNVLREHPLDRPTVHCLSATELTNRVYRLRFYDEPSLAHELVVLGQSDDVLFYSSFYRTDRRARFCKSEVDQMNGIARFAVNVLHRHFELMGKNSGGLSSPGLSCQSLTGERRQRMLRHLKDALLSQPYLLSPREAEVCAGIILGYTTLGISLNFGISVSTVATHRKRAYRKLGISSQNELFSRYFQVVTQHQASLAPI